jgi:hypothetical protein
LCAQRGAHVVLGGPFNSGFLAGGAHLRRNAALMDVAIPAAFWEELRAEGLVPQEAPLPLGQSVV